MEAALSMWRPQIVPPNTFTTVRRQEVTSRNRGQLACDPPATSALPGVPITAEVAANEGRRRIIHGMLVRFAAEKEISRTTLHSASALLAFLPSEAALPKVNVDDGGVLMAWTVPGKGRTLVTVVDNVLHAVVNAGTPDAAYLTDVPFDGSLPADLLRAIPR